MAANISTAVGSWTCVPGDNQPDGSDYAASLIDDIHAILAGVHAEETYSITSMTVNSAAGVLQLGGPGTFKYQNIFSTASGTVTRMWGYAGEIRNVCVVNNVTFKHDGTNIILPGEADLTAGTGDALTFISPVADQWRCVGGYRADGEPLVTHIRSQTVIGNLNVGGTLTCVGASKHVGAATFGNVVIAGTIDHAGSYSTQGHSNLYSFSAAGSGCVHETLSVGGNLTLGSNLTVSGNLSVQTGSWISGCVGGMWGSSPGGTTTWSSASSAVITPKMTEPVEIVRMKQGQYGNVQLNISPLHEGMFTGAGKSYFVPFYSLTIENPETNTACTLYVAQTSLSDPPIICSGNGMWSDGLHTLVGVSGLAQAARITMPTGNSRCEFVFTKGVNFSGPVIRMHIEEVFDSSVTAGYSTRPW